jgi:hypothetical protein
MIQYLKFSLILITLLCISTSAQSSFEVISLEGSAKVQRSQKRSWEKVAVGIKLSDNDLLETSFQTKLILRFGGNNLIIVGSNTKTLLNIMEKQDNDKTINNVNITVFSGGVFAKAISGCHISLYTANAVGEMDSGSVSTVADGKTGETGFQVLGGSIYVRNIAQQKGTLLRAGLTTMILPSKEPTAPLYITHRHVAVLKHFFGEDYISNEMDISGIKPTDDMSGNRLALSQNLSTSAKYADQGMYKTLFDLNRIYGGIIDDQSMWYKFYAPIQTQHYAVANKGRLELSSTIGLSPNKTQNSFALTPSIHNPHFEIALEIAISKDATSKMSGGFTTLEGILSKIKYLKTGRIADSSYISIGELQNYTLGYGMIVNRFSNFDPNRLFNPPGFKGQLHLFDKLDIKAFIGDLTLPLYGGAYASYDLLTYRIGAGFYFDANQYTERLNTKNLKYSTYSRPSNYTPDPKRNISNLNVYEVNFEAEIAAVYDIRVKLLLEFAQKLQNGNDGYIARIPTLLFDINKMSFGGGFLMETGRLVTSQFNSLYISNRSHLKYAELKGNPDTLFTQSTYLSQNRKATGIALLYKANPLKGMDIDVQYKQDLFSDDALNLIQADSTGDSSVDVNGDFTIFLKCKINDTLVPFIKYAEIFLEQTHGKLYPYNGKLFASWGTQIGFFLLTRPLLFNMAFEAGGTLLYIDTGYKLNNSIESNESVFELFLGLQWGFL